MAEVVGGVEAVDRPLAELVEVLFDHVDGRADGTGEHGQDIRLVVLPVAGLAHQDAHLDFARAAARRRDEAEALVVIPVGDAAGQSHRGPWFLIPRAQAVPWRW